jgi:uncharacterized membrane protein YhaH (DUF805 family)
MLLGGFEHFITSPDFFASMGILGVIFFFVLFIGVLVASLNIMAKRIRDMGLPGWKGVFGIILISFILGFLFPAQQMEINAVATQTPEGITSAINTDVSTGSIVTNIFNLLIFLCLVLIPTDTFGNKEKVDE